MANGYPRLLGDIGGTHARWAWQPDAASAPQDVQVRAVDGDASIGASAAAYLVGLASRAAPRWGCIGIATPVTGDHVQLTNGAWAFSTAELQRRIGLERLLVINDFTALAMSLPALAPADLAPLGGSAAVDGAPLALLGPGTGLGVSGLLPGAGWAALSGEGGHVTLAPVDDDEAALLALLRRRFGHVSAERVLSGSGLVHLYDAVCALHGRAPAAQSPAQVGDAALAASDDCAVSAVRLFSGFLGNVAGNLALTLGARGGVYVGGGVVPRLGSAFDAALFRRRFEQKGRFESYLAPIPAWLITAAAPALLGASHALDRGSNSSRHGGAACR